MRVRFWGVRGSVPWATSSSIGYGCNTACVEVTDEATGDTLILDAGSGIVGAGESLDGTAREIPILLSHFHWDHVQGLPFFAPVHRHGWTPTIWAPALGRDVAFDIGTLFAPPFFPVPFGRLPGKPVIRLATPGALTAGTFDVRMQRLNHPGGAYAYRVRGSGGDLVYATDHEFGDPEIDRELAAFASGAAAAILDAHFTPEESAAHRGWGHGAWRECAAFAAANGIGRLWLFHHKPGRTDDEMTSIEADARSVFAATDAAREGVSFSV